MEMDWKDSIYTDGSDAFVVPPLPKMREPVTIRLRILEDAPVVQVFLRTRINGGEERIPMCKERVSHGLQYYQATIHQTEAVLHYHFYIVTADTVYYYNQMGIGDEMPDEIYDFRIVYGYRQPAWVKKSVFYQIFPERFCNGDPDLSVKDGEYSFDGHDTIQVKDWEAEPKEYTDTYCLDFYGGDLVGIRHKIPYLQELGVNAIYLNPIFYGATVHKYDCLDYFTVDPHFGGDQALIDLVEALHGEDMRIILDVSINHTGIAHKWFNKEGTFFDLSVGAYHNPTNPERAYYFFGENNQYKAWWNVDTLPTLNYGSEALREILYKGENALVKHWLQPPFCTDGWRFDVADVMARSEEGQLHHEVWPELVDAIKSTKSDAYVVAEEWGDCGEFLQGNEWDTPMNYFGCARPVREYVGEHDLFLMREAMIQGTKPNQSAKALAKRILQHLGKIPFQMQLVQFNLLDSHDAPRLHNNPQISWERTKIAIALLFTLPGAPSIYYGDEAGIAGRLDTNEGFRYPMPWSREFQKEAPFLFYQRLARLKREEKAFQEGGFRILWAEGKIFSFVRCYKEQVYFIVTSVETEEKTITLPVEAYGIESGGMPQDIFGSKLQYKKLERDLEILVEPDRVYIFTMQ